MDTFLKPTDDVLNMGAAMEPVFIVEEEDDEESTVTIDFENKRIYEVEETLIIKESEPVSELPVLEAVVEEEDDTEVDLGTINPEPEKPLTIEDKGLAFKTGLQDILIDGLTSKAIASLLEKHYKLDRQMDITMDGNRGMGEMHRIIYNDMNKAMEKPRAELKACYNGASVRYDKIPEWAKSYVRDYVRESVHVIASLVEN